MEWTNLKRKNELVYEQLLQIPKAQKEIDEMTEFLSFWDLHS